MRKTNRNTWNLKEITIKGETVSSRNKKTKPVNLHVDTPEVFSLVQGDSLLTTRKTTIHAPDFTEKEVKEVVAEIQQNPYLSYVILDKKNSILYHNCDNIIGTKTSTQIQTFIANNTANQVLRDTLQDYLALCEFPLETKDIFAKVKIDHLKNNFTEKRTKSPHEINVKNCEQLSIYSNYYQFLTSYDVFNLANYHKQYVETVHKEPVLGFITQQIYEMSITSLPCGYMLKRRLK